MYRIFILALKETLHIGRDRRALILAFLTPIMLLLLFGYVLSLDIKGIKVGYVDRASKPWSRKLINTLRNLEGWTVIRVSESMYEDIVKGRFTAFLVIEEGNGPQFFVELNGENPTKAKYTVETLKTAILSALKDNGKAIMFAPSFVFRIWYNPELKSRIFIVPGLMVLILILLTALLPSITIAREYEEGTFEQLWITPLKTHEIFLGKLLPYFILGYIQMFLILFISHIAFGIPLKGLGSFLAISTLFLFTSSSIGVTLSSLTRNQQAAMQFTWLTTFLPSFFLSGFIFPIESMPRVLKAITYLVPARYYLHAIRGILLKGGSFIDYSKDALSLAIFGLFLLYLSVKRLEKK